MCLTALQLLRQLPLLLIMSCHLLQQLLMSKLPTHGLLLLQKLSFPQMLSFLLGFLSAYCLRGDLLAQLLDLAVCC